jgi:hypothetical protein
MCRIFRGGKLFPNDRTPPAISATLHDLTACTLQDCHRRADGLIAVSENTRQDVLRNVGINPSKIQVSS